MTSRSLRLISLIASGGVRRSAYALYTDPPLDRAGMTEAEVRRSGRPAMIATVAMERVSRAFEKGKRLKSRKFWSTKPASESWVRRFSAYRVTRSSIRDSRSSMYANVPYTLLQKAVHIHPTVSEYVPLMVSNLKDLR